MLTHKFSSVSSTLDVIHELAQHGAPGGTAVVAREQVEGRGTRGRPWHSPPGGLWLSILYRDVAPAAFEFLSLKIGIALALAVESVAADLRVLLKWPNDLMMEGRKLGGILCEARWQGAAPGWIGAGVGLNVSNPIPPELGGHAIALRERCPGLEPEDLVDPVSAALRAIPASEARLRSEALIQIRERDWLRGKRLREPAPGTACGIADDGSLLVEQEPGRILPIRAGHILLE